MCGHLPSISQTIHLKQARHARHCWSRDVLISEIFLWTPIHGHSSVGQSVKKTYIHHLFCYTAMCTAGLQGAVHSHQVNQLTQGTDVGCGLLTLYNVADIINSLAEPHFKATRWVIGELLKVNTTYWQAFLLKYKVFDKYNTSTTKKGHWTAMFGLTRLITIFFYWIKERNKEKKTIPVKVRSEKVFLYLGRASVKIFVSRTRSPFDIY